MPIHSLGLLALVRVLALLQTTAAATSKAELTASLLRVNGPVLGPADLANPLP